MICVFVIIMINKKYCFVMSYRLVKFLFNLILILVVSFLTSLLILFSCLNFLLIKIILYFYTYHIKIIIIHIKIIKMIIKITKMIITIKKVILSYSLVY